MDHIFIILAVLYGVVLGWKGVADLREVSRSCELAAAVGRSRDDSAARKARVWLRWS